MDGAFGQFMLMHGGMDEGRFLYSLAGVAAT